MAIELGAAYISILPSTDKIAPGVKDALGDAEDEAKRSGDRAGSNFGGGFKAKMGSVLKGGLLAGIAGAGLLGGLGVKTAAEMETANIAFTTMLGSADKAKSFIEDLTDFAAKTPFEFPGLQDSASKLIAAGIGVKDVIPIMTTLGDVTSGMGTGAEGINRATIALQQMNAAGKVNAEDLNQLRDAGIPVYDLLSASMGKTKAEVVDMAQKGTLGMEGLQAVMSGLKTGKGLEKFNGLMEKQADTLTGKWSTFKDTLQMGLANALTPLIPMLKDGLGGAAKILPPVLTAVAKALKLIVGAVVAVVSWGQKHKTLVTVLGSVVAALVAGLIAYNVTVKIITTATKLWTTATMLLNGTLALNPIGLVVAAIAALVVGFIIAYKKSETFRNIVHGALHGVLVAGRAVGNFFTQKIPAAFNKVKSAAGNAIGWVKQNWPKILAVLTGPFGLAVLAIAKNWGKIKAGAGAVKDFVVKKFTDLIGFFRGAPGKIGSAVSGMFDGIRDNFLSVLRGIQDAWNRLEFKVNIPDAIPGLPDDFTVSTPDVHLFAKGGIVTKATPGIFGEAGPEAVMPLDRLDTMLDKAAGVGMAHAEGKGYSNLSPTGAGAGSRRVEFVITNWQTGEGHFREIAEDVYTGEDDFAGTTRRMR